jgi:hypothetical protein
MPLPEVEAMLRDAGVCFEFRYGSYDAVGEDFTASGPRERRCSAPPRGEITSLG